MERYYEEYLRKPASDDQSVRKPMISIGLVDENSFTRECITRSLKEADQSLDTVAFKTLDECVREARDFDIIILHIHHETEHYKKMENNLTS